MKNKSELLLEAYLRSQGYNDYAFEPVIAGSSRRPDYRLRADGVDLLLEVKEFRADPTDPRPRSGIFDPYPALREKINAAREKFKRLKQYCCCLVLHNVNKPLVLLDQQHIYGAMLGDLGFSVPVALSGRPVPADARPAKIFMSGGKMHRERGGVPTAPQNQTISAILVLGRLPTGQRLFNAGLREREAVLGRRLAHDEFLRELDLARGTPRDPRRRPLRVVVHENPYARVPVPSTLFRGLCDERFGELAGRVQRLFVGEYAAELDGTAEP